MSGPIAHLTAFVLLMLLGRMTRIEGSETAVWWPAAGVSLLWGARSVTRGALATCGSLVALATFLTNVVTGLDPRLSVFFGLAGAALALSARAAVVLTTPSNSPWRHGHPTLTVPRHLATLVVASGTGVAASVPLMMAGHYVVFDQVSPLTVVQYVTRNFVGAFAVAGLWMVYVDHRAARRATAGARGPVLGDRALEAGALFVLTTAAVLVVFAGDQTLPLSFLVIAFSVWAGARFSPFWSAVHAVGVATSAAVLVAIGAGGPLRPSDPFEAVFVLQALAAVSLLVALFLSLATREKDALARSLEEAERKARDRADLLEVITDDMLDGLLVLDSDGDTLVRNRAALALLGENGAAPDGGRAVSAFVRPDGSQIPADQQPSELALRGVRTQATDILMVHPETGERRILSVSAAPVGQGSTNGQRLAVLLFRDVTGRHQQLRQLQGFAGMVAHDLQNPLSASKGWLALLEERVAELRRRAPASPEDGVQEGVEEALRRATSSLGRAQALVHDLLSFTQATTADLTVSPVDLDELFEREMADLRIRYGQPDAVLEKQPLGVVHLDPTQAQQIIANLVGNALKYVAPGVVPHITVSLVRREDTVTLEVADNGIGISDKHKHRVFDAFHRAQQDVPGTGLGLAICAQAIERHGGTVTLRDNPAGSGTVFSIVVPATPTDPDAATSGW